MTELIETPIEQKPAKSEFNSKFNIKIKNIFIKLRII